MRVNTLIISFDDACNCLKYEGFIIEKLENNISSKDFINKISKLQKNMVYIDNHIENLLIFAPGLNLHEFCLKNNGFILQDKVNKLKKLYFFIFVTTLRLVVYHQLY